MYCDAWARCAAQLACSCCSPCQPHKHPRGSSGRSRLHAGRPWDARWGPELLEPAGVAVHQQGSAPRDGRYERRRQRLPELQPVRRRICRPVHGARVRVAERPHDRPRCTAGQQLERRLPGERQGRRRRHVGERDDRPDHGLAGRACGGLQERQGDWTSAPCPGATRVRRSRSTISASFRGSPRTGPKIRSRCSGGALRHGRSSGRTA